MRLRETHPDDARELEEACVEIEKGARAALWLSGHPQIKEEGSFSGLCCTLGATSARTWRWFPFRAPCYRPSAPARDKHVNPHGAVAGGSAYERPPPKTSASAIFRAAAQTETLGEPR